MKQDQEHLKFQDPQELIMLQVLLSQEIYFLLHK